MIVHLIKIYEFISNLKDSYYTLSNKSQIEGSVGRSFEEFCIAKFAGQRGYENVPCQTPTQNSYTAIENWVSKSTPLHCPPSARNNRLSYFVQNGLRRFLSWSDE